ncbi:MAG: peptidylprolyl isomerase [Oscillatoriales cyanobacterium RM2_1_1]|nr:peptidylprolyl isomerase [Oscillatoriales cyanobacterium SM2_3_0]NJO45166.1 peptidylprolyl isomerase [Oscillatoriales cyanobacterium RM2_1_1]
MVKVDLSNTELEQAEILNFLQRHLRIRDISQQVLSQKIIDQTAEERGITVTTEEIQVEADSQRHSRRLEKASDTLDWLTEQLVTPEEWEAGIRDCLLAKKLSEHLFADQVEKFFAENRLDYDQIVFYQIVLPNERIAREVFYQIEEEEISFYFAAHLYDIDQNRRQRCGYEGKLSRRSFKPELAAAVFAAIPGEVTQPIETPEGYHLILVEEFIPAELTPEREQEIIKRLFSDWLTSEINFHLHHRQE